MARLAFALSLALGAACAAPAEEATPGPAPGQPEDPQDPGDPQDPEDPEEPVPPPPPAACSASASYRITLDMSWDPVGVPNPHWSPLVGATHSGELQLWELGETATDGIETMAETGATGPLVAEIESAVLDGTSDGAIVGGPIALSPGATSVDIDVSRDYSQITLVSMLAPSPDWFVGVGGLELCNDGTWFEGVVELVVYDAGTDSGDTFTAANSDTVPRQPIGLEAGFASGPSPEVVGVLHFEILE